MSSGGHVIFPTPAGYRGEGVFDNFWKLIARWKVTFIVGVPTAISALMQRPVDADISSVKSSFSGSAPLPIELYKRFEEASGVNIVEGYGLTEATCLVSFNPMTEPKKIGSVGVRLPYCLIKVVKKEKMRWSNVRPMKLVKFAFPTPGCGLATPIPKRRRT